MIRMLLLIAMLIVPVTPAVAQDDLQAALDIGYRGDEAFERLVGNCEASRRGGGFLGRLGAGLIDGLASGFDVLRWGGEYNVTVQTQYGLAAEVANRAARHFKPAPTLQDVPLDIRAPLLRIRVTPKGDRDELLGYNMQASIDHIVVGPRENVTVETAVQPVGELVTDSVGFQNLFGAALVVPSNTAMASFALEDVLAVTANADLRIYIISPGGSGSWDCDIDANDVRRMAMVQ
jgi:hypothetical protein